MSEDTKSVENNKAAAELSEQELNEVAGGTQPKGTPTTSEIVVTKVLDSPSPKF